MRIMKLAIDDEVSPLFTLSDNPDKIRNMMFSNEHIEKMDDREPETLMKLEENPRWVKGQNKERYAYDESGKEFSKIRVFNVRDALFEAVFEKFYVDPTLVAFGEENRDWGGAFGVYSGMTEALPYNRLFNAPISEEQICACAVGYGMAGGRAIPELMYTDFLARAADSVFNQLPKWQSMSANLFKMPVVLRISCGAKYGPQHAQIGVHFVTYSGLQVVYPVTPYDCKGLMNAALSGSDPVVFFESQRIYDMGEHFHSEGVPKDYYEIPIGEPDIKRSGKDVTILTIGPSLYAAVDAADELQEKYGVEAELIDARSLVPFNYDLLIESVKKTGRLLIVCDAVERNCFASDIARNMTEFVFTYLDAPPVIVAAPNVISPFAYIDKFYYPQAHWILDAIHQQLINLDGYKPINNYTSVEKQRRAKLGI